MIRYNHFLICWFGSIVAAAYELTNLFWDDNSTRDGGSRTKKSRHEFLSTKVGRLPYLQSLLVVNMLMLRGGNCSRNNTFHVINRWRQLRNRAWLTWSHGITLCRKSHSFWKELTIFLLSQPSKLFGDNRRIPRKHAIHRELGSWHNWTWLEF